MLFRSISSELVATHQNVLYDTIHDDSSRNDMSFYHVVTYRHKNIIICDYIEYYECHNRNDNNFPHIYNIIKIDIHIYSNILFTLNNFQYVFTILWMLFMVLSTIQNHDKNLKYLLT